MNSFILCLLLVVCVAGTQIKIGSPAPSFTKQAVVKTDKGPEIRELSLKDYIGQWVVLLFYPLDFTFVCPTELLAFSDRVGEFKKLGAEVLAISVDSEFTHLAWAKTPRDQGGVENLAIPMVSDLTKELATTYGVLVDDAGVALRGSFLVDPKGVLRQITMNDLPVGRSVDEQLRLIEAFQFTDKHGRVCPANWKPGDDTIDPDPVGKLEFFGKK